MHHDGQLKYRQKQFDHVTGQYIYRTQRYSITIEELKERIKMGFVSSIDLENNSIFFTVNIKDSSTNKKPRYSSTPIKKQKLLFSYDDQAGNDTSDDIDVLASELSKIYLQDMSTQTYSQNTIDCDGTMLQEMCRLLPALCEQLSEMDPVHGQRLVEMSSLLGEGKHML